jgi:hypothetical protein
MCHFEGNIATCWTPTKAPMLHVMEGIYRSVAYVYVNRPTYLLANIVSYLPIYVLVLGCINLLFAS